MFEEKIKFNNRTFLNWEDPENVKFRGEEMPSGIKVLTENGTALAIHVPGHNYWVGIGIEKRRGYERAETQVRIKEKGLKGKKGWTYCLASWNRSD